MYTGKGAYPYLSFSQSAMNIDCSQEQHFVCKRKEEKGIWNITISELVDMNLKDGCCMSLDHVYLSDKLSEKIGTSKSTPVGWLQLFQLTIRILKTNHICFAIQQPS